MTPSVSPRIRSKTLFYLAFSHTVSRRTFVPYPHGMVCFGYAVIRPRDTATFAH